MRCVVVRLGGRLLLRLNEKTLLEPPPGMKGVLPGALVEIESRYEAGRGMVATRLEEVLAPGGGTPIAEARAYRERGLFAEARTILGEGPLSDPAALATRVRLKLDAGKSAEADLLALLETREGDASEPWDVASLFKDIGNPALMPALAIWLAKTRLAPGSPAVQRALELAPPTAWTAEQLFARLSRAGASQRDVLANAVAEAKARGIEGDALALAEETLGAVVAAADVKSSLKRAHPVLRAAIRAAHKRVRPAPPFHLCGPAPKLTIADLVHVAAFCAERVRGVVAASDLAEFDRVLGLLSQDDIRGEPIGPMPGEGPMSVLRHACIARIRGDAYNALQEARYAAAAAMKALQSAKSFEEAASLVRDLDLRIVHREWQVLIDAHREGAPEVARLLWRGDDGKRALGHVLVRTKDEGIALLSKAARRWRWHTGSRDDVLATIPDAHFAEAARRAG